jgi:hypothetical protein
MQRKAYHKGCVIWFLGISRPVQASLQLFVFSIYSLIHCDPQPNLQEAILVSAGK